MKHNRFLGALLALSVLSGCSFSRTIGEHAVEYNRAIAAAENEILLLNIVRASRQYPMYFTRVSEITGALSVSPSSSVTVPVGGGANDLFTGVFGLSGSSKPTYSIRVLDGQEFFNGFMKPVDQDVFASYLASGWPMRTLINAFVEEAILVLEENDQTLTCKIISDPDSPNWNDGDPNSPQERMYKLGTLLKRARSLDTTVEKVPYGPPLPLSSIDDIAAIAILKEAGISLSPTLVNEKQIQLTTSKTRQTFTVSNGKKGTEFSKGAIKTLSDMEDSDGIDFCPDDSPLFVRTNPAETKVAATLVLRSAQDILYAYGEMLNFSQVEEHLQAAQKYGYFIAEHGASAPDSSIRTELDGELYWIPKGAAYRESRRLLRLARQVFSLNTSAKDAPKTETIRFIAN